DRVPHHAEAGRAVSWSRDEMVRRGGGGGGGGPIVELGLGGAPQGGHFIPGGGGVSPPPPRGPPRRGPLPSAREAAPPRLNTGKQPVTPVAGASTFDSALSFAMIRGRHVDLAILGGLEVACTGDLANWTVPGKLITGMGGAMDLAAGARRVVVLQSHVAKDGKPKLVNEVTLPVTALACVNRVITELGVFDVAG